MLLPILAFQQLLRRILKRLIDIFLQRSINRQLHILPRHRLPFYDHLRKPGLRLDGVTGSLLAIVIVAIAGAITALGDTLFPAHTLLEGVRADFESTANFLVRLRIIHPVLAIAAGMLLAVIAGREFLARRSGRLRWLSGALLLLVLAQILAGAANILLRAPLPMQLLHLLLADSLWITLVLFATERRAVR